jgi:hypothetical protein
MKFTIYKHTNNISGKSYIGFTKNTIEERWKEHVLRAYECKYNHKFDNALRKYNTDNWIHEILVDNIPSLEEAKQKEIEMIAQYDTFVTGYNSTIGGNGGSKIVSEGTKEKLRNYRTGKHLSETAKQKLSIFQKSRKRKPLSQEHKNKLSQSLKGRKIPLEEKEKQKLGFERVKNAR